MTDQQQQNPFGEHEAPGIQLIVQMRIYDVLMALLQASNPEMTNDLLELHMSGSLVGTAPSFNGNFIADTLNIQN